MKICYLCQDLGIPLDGIKGASAHIRGVVRAIKSLGHEIVVITSSAEGDAGLGVPVVVIPKAGFLEGSVKKEQPKMARALGHTCNNVMAEQTLLKVIDEFGPDFIYERYSPFAIAGSTVAKEKGIFHILEVNAMLAEEGRLYRKQALQQVCELFERSVFNDTSLILTVSDELRESLVVSGIASKKIATVPNGVDEMFFCALENSLQAKSEEKIVIGFVGSLKPWHGIDMLTETFRRIADDPIYHLLVIGDGPERKVVNKLKKEFPGRVTCSGGVNHDDVPEYIDGIDIALAPYPQLETFYFSPLKVLEYMARGKAIIASDIGQISSLIDHGENGWKVPPGDVDSLVGAIKMLSKDHALRKKLGEKAAEQARQQHSWKDRAILILDIVKKTEKAKTNIQQIQA